MKRIALALLSLAASTYADPVPLHPGDTLEVDTQFGATVYTGHISQFDTEDAIGQIEINDALVQVFTEDGEGTIFTNGFESYNVNWIWVGDDQSGNEFGGAGDCTERDWTDTDNSFHVVLSCYQIENEAH